ncbi:TPA: hypothetical protein MIP63_27310, partial [Klebsiella pneumoniae]|nr:hypothetical protein [Klebsiella pneumoniae]
FGKKVILLLYGEQYVNSYGIIIILCISTVITAMGFISNRYIVRLSGYKYLSKKTLLVLGLSIPISTTMVYFFGVYGAAYSVLIVEFLSLTIMNYFFNHGVILKVHRGAFNLKKIASLR